MAVVNGILKIGIAGWLALLASTALGREFVQTGNAMAPTIAANQTIEVPLLSGLTYHPERWDVVALENPDAPNLLVFRIVGMPNETIRLTQARVYINGKRLALPARLREAGVMYLPREDVMSLDNPPGDETYTTGDNEYFVLGDNTLTANDSRFLGVVPRHAILNRLQGKY